MSVTSANGDLLTPIPGDNPAGISLRYDPVFDQIKVARKEDDGMPQGDWQTSRKTADWPLVVRLASEALTKKSKDLQIAAWLAEAWLHKEGFPGLQRGLDLNRELLEQFWDTIHPQIEDGDAEMRVASLEWIGLKFDAPIKLVPIDQDGHSLNDYRVSRKVPSKDDADRDSGRATAREQAIAEGKVTPEDFERSIKATPKDWYRKLVGDIDSSLQSLAELDKVCTEKFGNLAPRLTPARDAIQEVRLVAAQLLTRKLEDDPDPPGVDAFATGDTSGAVAGAVAGGAMLANISAGPKSSEEAAMWIAAAARHIRNERPMEPTAYLLLRGFRWGELRTPDRQIDPRMLVAPSTDLRSRLKGMLIDGSWPELLNAAEEVLAQPQGRGWLDLQRYALTASDGLGSDYEAVSNALRSSLRSLLNDLPSLTAQTMMDDSPSANPETMAWLRDQKLLPDGTDTTEIPDQARTSSSSSRRDPYEIALARSKAGDARGAMDLLMRESAREKSTRARFLRRAQAAEIMVGADMEAVALPILRELMQQIESFRLEEWEAGDTVALPLGLLYRCVIRVDGSDIDARSLYDRVCRLDPVRAIQIKPAHSDNEGS